MGAVAVGIPRREKLNGFIDCADWTANWARGLMSFNEEASSDNLPIAIPGCKLNPGLANTLPSAGNRAEIQIGKTPPLRPNPGIEDAYNDVRSIIRL